VRDRPGEPTGSRAPETRPEVIALLATPATDNGATALLATRVFGGPAIRGGVRFARTAAAGTTT